MRRRALAFFFGVWVAGVQLAELFAVIGALGVAVLLLAELIAERRRPEVTFDEWLLFAFLFCAVFFPLLAGAAPTGTGVARLLALAATPIAAAAALKLSPAQLRGALVAAGAVLLLSCATAALQHFGAWPSADRMELLGALRLPFTRVYEEVPGAPGRYMAGGFLFHRLKFAHVSGLAVIAFAALALGAAGRDRLLAGAVAVAGLASIVWFPFARAAAAALIGALLLLGGVTALRGFGNTRRAVLAAGAALVALALILVAVNEPFRARILRAESDEGSGGRIHLLEAGKAALKSKPVTGIGIGHFKAAEWAPLGSPSYVTEHRGKTHNQLLSIAVESGVLSALLFVVWLVALAVRLWRSTSPASGLASLAFFVALSVLHDPLFHAEFGLALPLALGTPLFLKDTAGAKPRPPGAHPERDAGAG